MCAPVSSVIFLKLTEESELFLIDFLCVFCVTPRFLGLEVLGLESGFGCKMAQIIWMLLLLFRMFSLVIK